VRAPPTNRRNPLAGEYLGMTPLQSAKDIVSPADLIVARCSARRAVATSGRLSEPEGGIWPLSYHEKRFQTPSQAPDDSRESAHKACVYIKDQPSWQIPVSNCIYETYDLGGYWHRIR
jgi:hypothetical protein